MNRSNKIYIAGHRGMVGAAVCRALQTRGYRELITATRGELDLRDQAQTYSFLRESKPDVVVVAAAKVGGIHANNTYPADFIYENLITATNVIYGSFAAGVKRLLFLGSACIYPKLAPQPIKEEHLLTGPLEPTNEPYAVAKIAAIKLCESLRRQHGVVYHSLMPNNLYGPGDNYHPENSHVIPGLLRRLHEAKLKGASEVVVWGSGRPRREFVYVEDLADAIVHILELESPPDLVNVGYGEDIAIGELAKLIAKTVGYTGKIVQDEAKPDGTPRKLLDSTLMHRTGWRARTSLEAGLTATYQAYCARAANSFSTCRSKAKS